MLTSGGTPVLMDFGSMAPAERRVRNRSEALAVQDEASRHSTLPFRAPELFDVSSDAVLDSRTDVWSLGCLLYALRFGYSPFECELVGGGGGEPRPGGPPGGHAGVRVVECTFLRVIGQVSRLLGWVARWGHTLARVGERGDFFLRRVVSSFPCVLHGVHRPCRHAAVDGCLTRLSVSGRLALGVFVAARTCTEWMLQGFFPNGWAGVGWPTGAGVVHARAGSTEASLRGGGAGARRCAGGHGGEQ